MKKIFMTLAVALFTLGSYAQENLVVNGDFEDPDGSNVPNDWVIDHGIDDGTVVVNKGKNGIGGSYSLKLNVANKTYNCSASQNIAVEAGETYTFDCYGWYSATIGTGTTAEVQILNAADDSSIYTYAVPVVFISGDTNPQLNDATIMHTFNFTVPAGCEEITLKFWSGLIDKLVRFDNVTIVKYEEGDTDVTDPDVTDPDVTDPDVTDPDTELETDSTNLIYNGDFELYYLESTDTYKYSTGWVFDQGDSGVLNAVMAGTTNGVDKTGNLKLNVSNKSYDCSASQNITVEGNTEYAFDGYAWYSNVPANNALSEIQILDATNEDAEIYIYEVPTTAYSSTVSADGYAATGIAEIMHGFTFTTPASCTEITLKIWSGAIDKLIRLDNLVLAKVETDDDTDVDGEWSGVETSMATSPAVCVSNGSLLFDQEVSVAIYDLTGKQVQIATATSVSIDHLATGLYIVRATDAMGNTNVAKIVK